MLVFIYSTYLGSLNYFSSNITFKYLFYEGVFS